MRPFTKCDRDKAREEAWLKGWRDASSWLRELRRVQQTCNPADLPGWLAHQIRYLQFRFNLLVADEADQFALPVEELRRQAEELERQFRELLEKRLHRLRGCS
jgi:hypothetical protein